MAGRHPGSRTEQKAQTREALLDAARSVLRREGLAGATSRRIAAEAGVAAGTFFVHFRDRDALVEALLDAHLERALTTAFDTLPREAHLVDALVHVSSRLLDSYDVEPELSRAYITASLFGEASDGPGAARLARFRDWVVGRITDAVRRGEIPAIDPAVAFTVFFSLYFGLLVAGLRGTLARPEQLAVMTSALRRLFSVEVVP